MKAIQDVVKVLTLVLVLMITMREASAEEFGDHLSFCQKTDQQMLVFEKQAVDNGLADGTWVKSRSEFGTEFLMVSNMTGAFSFLQNNFLGALTSATLKPAQLEFILQHEKAHNALHHVREKCNEILSQGTISTAFLHAQEMAADKAAIEATKRLGIHYSQSDLFEILSQFEKEETVTHPSVFQRVNAMLKLI